MEEGAGGAVAGVGDYFNATGELELRGDGVEIGVGDVDGFMGARAGCEIVGFDQTKNFLNGFAVEGAGAADGFETVEFGGIVAAGDHDGSVGVEMHGGKIE